MLLMDEAFRENLIHAESVEQFLAYVDEAEKEKFGEEDASEETNAKEEQKKEKHQSVRGTLPDSCSDSLSYWNCSYLYGGRKS